LVTRSRKISIPIEQEKMMARIGFDFGTTNSAIGLVTDAGAVSLQGPLPSIGAWRNGEIRFFGDAKEDLRSEDSSFHPVRDLKMLLGVGDINVGRRQLSSIELASQMISKLTSKAVKGDIDLAVLSTPVKFSETQRSALLQAASMAGLETVKLVYEPTAALVGALGENDAEDGVSLIVDWGGGTLDIAVVEKKRESFRELAVGGDVDKLGGSRIDQDIAKKVLADHPEIEKIISKNEGYFERFLEDIEDEKIDILDDIDGEDGESRMIAPAWAEGEFVDFEPSLVFEMLRKYAKEAGAQVLSLLRETHVDLNDITYLVFAGGVCNSPDVRDLLSDLFPRARELSSQNPQLITAQGCTVLAKTGFDIELAANFGVRQCDGSVCCILPNGMSLAAATYRTAEFLLTDVYAPEAVFEFGINKEGVENQQSLAMTSVSFTSLGQLFVPVSHRERSNSPEVADRIRIYAGIDHSLTVKIHAESLVGNAKKTIAVTGVPLAIQRGGKN
jgi:molecular chaperone DnaK (HSP70)